MRVQIDETLWWDLVEYHMRGSQGPELELRIRAGLQEKLDAMTRRTLYTQSKTAQDPKSRELARQEYLDERGVPEEYRY